MARLLAALLLLAAAGLPGRAAIADHRPHGQDGEWRRIFADSFTGTRLDRNKWTTCYWWDEGGCTNLGNRELQWYQPGNVTVVDGHVRLRAQRQRVVGINDTAFPYTSGMITTGPARYRAPEGAKFDFQYGYAEMRAWVPRGKGLWPAFWLLPSSYNSTPEIDVMEVLGQAPHVLQMHFHYRDKNRSLFSVGNGATVGDLSTGWHIYGVDWQPDRIIWYLDGKEQWRYENKAAIPREPMYLLVNLAVGGEWPGAPNNATQFPADYLIDYVRVWQRAN
jgi:beta-glucanase (GH16 family)